MKSPTLVLTAALLAALAITGSTATAADFTSFQSGAWDLGATWGNGGDVQGTDFPGTGDTATIAAGHTVDVDGTADRFVATLTIEDAACGSTPGVLEIKQDSDLEIEASLVMEHDLATPGRIIFTASAGTAGNLTVSTALTMDGLIRVDGSIGGTITSDAAEDELTISWCGRVQAPDGPLTISAEIINNGRITANGRDSGNDITFTGSSVQAASCGTFEVVRCDATMEFNLTNAFTFTGLANINVEAGTMKFSQDVTTADSALGGGLRVVLGIVEVAINKSLDIQGAFTGW